MTTDEVLALLSAGRQGEWWNLFGANADGFGKCWRCLETDTRTPLQTCRACREELADA